MLTKRSQKLVRQARVNGRWVVWPRPPDRGKLPLVKPRHKQPGVDRTVAAVAQAELELLYQIYSLKQDESHKSVEQGALVQVGQPLMAIVPGDVWVTANLKESQIGRIRPGQSVDIYVMLFRAKFSKVVDSIQAGTGAQFGLLPPRMLPETTSRLCND
jgi:membrane fusion protein (multidrug efflux system)